MHRATRGSGLTTDSDALIVKTYAMFAPAMRLVVPIGDRQVDRNGALGSIAGFPAITVPGGFSPTCDAAPVGVPVGLEFLGRPWSEPALVRIAFGFEQATRFRRPPRSVPPLI